MPSLYRCQYSRCPYCSASFNSVTQHVSKDRYREHYVEEASIVLGKEEISAPAQGREWGSSGDDGDVLGMADELEREKRLQLALEGKLNISYFCFFSARLAVRVTERDGRHEV